MQVAHFRPARLIFDDQYARFKHLDRNGLQLFVRASQSPSRKRRHAKRYCQLRVDRTQRVRWA